MPKPEAGPGDVRSDREKLIDRIRRLRRLNRQIRELSEGAGAATNSAELRELREERAYLRLRIDDLIEGNPRLERVADDLNYSSDDEIGGSDNIQVGDDVRDEDKGGRDGRSEGSPTGDTGARSEQGGKRGGGNDRGPRFGKHGPNWKLPGVRGKDFEIVRSPKGVQYAVYEMTFNGKSVRVGVRLPRNENELAKYGIKKGEGRLLSAAQIKKYKRAGHADELEFHGEDRHPFQALQRKLTRAYEGSGLLEHPDVMRTIIMQHIFGWSPAEFQNQLRNTQWYSNTSEWQRSWKLDKKEGDRQAIIQDVRQQMIQGLEDRYGFEWAKYVKPDEVRKIAAKIAAGEWGTSGNPTTGMGAWLKAQERAAQKIEGTPAWMNREQTEEETRAFANRPEDMFEQLRNQAIEYLGYAGREKPVLDRDTLMGWAEDLVTERKSDGDWQQFLRQQMKALHPYFDPNIAFTQQASPYKSVMESVLKTPIGWDDPLLRSFAGTDDKGKRTGDPLALHDFEVRVRQDERAWQEGTALWDEGHNIVAQLESTLLGVQ